MKNIDVNSATIGMLAVSEEFRKQGLAGILLSKAEEVAISKGIKKLNLGARPTAIEFYRKMGYDFTLMVQVFDFETIDNVLELNIDYRNFPVLNTFQDVTYGFVFFAVDNLIIEDLQYFESKLDICSVLFVFTKNISS